MKVTVMLHSNVINSLRREIKICFFFVFIFKGKKVVEYITVRTAEQTFVPSEKFLEV